MSESELSNFGRTLEPFPIVLLNRGAPRNNGQSAGIKVASSRNMAAIAGASPANTALRYLSAPATTDGSVDVGASTFVAPCAQSAAGKQALKSMRVVMILYILASSSIRLAAKVAA
jgi:hypothetical protein